MCAGRLISYYAEQAKERQGTRTDIKENLPECLNKGQARDQAGKDFGVSGKRARKLSPRDSRVVISRKSYNVLAPK